MILEIIIALTIGIISGIFTGLIPGIHINLIVAGLVTISFSQINETALIVYIVALAVTHTFIDFIPSIYFGAASEDTAISILPGHKFLLEGDGQKAVYLTVIGSSIAILSLIIVIPVMALIIKTSYPFIQRMMGFILSVTIIFLISQERKNKGFAVIVFLLAGFLGIITLNSNISEPLLPLLSGLFGASTLINSINQKAKVPIQKDYKLKISKKELIKPTLLTLLVSPICSLLPGLGSSQAAVISSKMTKKISRDQFLILLGSINTLVIATSFVTLYFIGKTRTGASYAISQITNLTPTTLILIISIIILTSIIVAPITIFLSRKLSKRIHKINYKRITLTILIFLSILVFVISGIFGFLIYINGAVIGLLTIKRNVSKSHLMGGILLPTVLYYLPF